MKINLFKYPIGTVVKHVREDEELWGHVTGFGQDSKTSKVMLLVEWHHNFFDDSYAISPEDVTTYNDL